MMEKKRKFLNLQLIVMTVLRLYTSPLFASVYVPQINKTRVVLLLVQRLPNFFQRFISLTFKCYCLLRTNRTKSKPPPTSEYYYEHLVSCSGGLLRARQMACSSLRPSSSTSSSRSQRFKWKTQRVVIRFELPRHLKLQIQGRLSPGQELYNNVPRSLLPLSHSFFIFRFLVLVLCLLLESWSSINQEAYHRRVNYNHAT